MTICQSCSGKSDLFLCSRCVGDLRAALNALPQWLQWLGESAIGQTRMGDSGGRSTGRKEPFKGEDDVLAPCRCGHPAHDLECVETIDDERIPNISGGSMHLCTCPEYQPVRDLRAQFLAAGRVNPRAANQLKDIHTNLKKWVSDTAQHCGIIFVRTTFIGPLPPGHHRQSATIPALIAFLTAHTHDIATDESAGECFHDLTGHQHAIEKIINRPIPPRFVGPCPSTVDYGHTRDCNQSHPHVCGNRLMAKRDAIEVTCRACKRTHNVELLIKRLLADIDEWRFTVGEIHQIVILLGEHLPARTFQHWRKAGPNGEPPKIKIKGYRSVDGRRITISRHDETDLPVFRLSDVRKAMDSRKVKAQ